MGKSEKINQTELLSARDREAKENFVILPKACINPIYETLKNPLEDFEIAVYTVVDAMRTTLFEAAVLDVKKILALLGYYPNSSNIQRVKKALLVLQREEILIVSEEKEFNYCVLNLETNKTYYIKRCIEFQIQNGEKKLYYAYMQNEGFVKIFNSDLLKMLDTNVMHKDKLLRVYIEIMQRIFYTNTNARVAFPSIEKMAGDTGFDRKTVMKMINELYELEVLICIQLKYEEKSKNFYSRPIHQQELREYVQSYVLENKNHYGTPKVIHKGIWHEASVAS